MELLGHINHIAKSVPDLDALWAEAAVRDWARERGYVPPESVAMDERRMTGNFVVGPEKTVPDAIGRAYLEKTPFTYRGNPILFEVWTQSRKALALAEDRVVRVINWLRDCEREGLLDGRGTLQGFGFSARYLLGVIYQVRDSLLVVHPSGQDHQVVMALWRDGVQAYEAAVQLVEHLVEHSQADPNTALGLVHLLEELLTTRPVHQRRGITEGWHESSTPGATRDLAAATA